MHRTPQLAWNPGPVVMRMARLSRRAPHRETAGGLLARRGHGDELLRSQHEHDRPLLRDRRELTQRERRPEPGGEVHGEPDALRFRGEELEAQTRLDEAQPDAPRYPTLGERLEPVSDPREIAGLDRRIDSLERIRPVRDDHPDHAPVIGR